MNDKWSSPNYYKLDRIDERDTLWAQYFFEIYFEETLMDSQTGTVENGPLDWGGGFGIVTAHIFEGVQAHDD